MPSVGRDPHSRHDRARRADADPRRRPSDGFRAGSARRFRRLVEDAIAELPGVVGDPAAAAALRIEDVPDAAAEPAPAYPDEVPLARYEDGPPPSLVVFRRPVELRAERRADLHELIRTAVGMEIASAKGIPDDAWLPPEDDETW